MRYYDWLFYKKLNHNPLILHKLSLKKFICVTIIIILSRRFAKNNIEQKIHSFVRFHPVAMAIMRYHPVIIPRGRRYLNVWVNIAF